MSKHDVATPMPQIQAGPLPEAKTTQDETAFDAAVERAVQRVSATAKAESLPMAKQPVPRDIGATEKDYGKDALKCARQFIEDKTLPTDIKHPRNVFTFATGRVPAAILAWFKLGGFSSWSDVGHAIERAQARSIEHEIPFGWSDGPHPRSSKNNTK